MRTTLKAAAALAVLLLAVLSLIITDMLGWAGLWPAWG